MVLHTSPAYIYILLSADKRNAIIGAPLGMMDAAISVDWDRKSYTATAAREMEEKRLVVGRLERRRECHGQRALVAGRLELH